jgi:protein-tyrosine-phosphatase
MKYSTGIFFWLTGMLMVTFSACQMPGSDNQASNAKSTMSQHHSESSLLLPAIEAYVKEKASDFSSISQERKAALEKVRDHIKERKLKDDSLALIFICTHNSRRSHMSQLWAQAMAAYHQVDGISCYSGGTEATAFNPRAVRAIANSGFEISTADSSGNPVYLVSFASGYPPVQAFSKRFSDPFNPQDGFLAIMTCSDADEACPFVPGAEARFSIPYEDPKIADGTPAEEERYAERCRQIATEMNYLFSGI